MTAPERAASSAHDWRTMPPGRELEAIVARLVMGHGGHFAPSVVINDVRRDVVTWVRDGDDPDDMPAGAYAGERPPRYSTDIAAAWSIVDAMAARGFYLSLRTPFAVHPLDSELRNHHAVFVPHGLYEGFDAPSYGRSGDTAPLAICRAALAAVESVT